ncbi:hypothetical protein QR680_015792 [Steinernema hermaphroditum]|uniref:Uncharacterized protein n=1 Tax=Steinernema hermaphroditum TaxID=289476 RepID=A0AA39H8Z3_9BILA|nr:hypothetical protein QR680_015792 [Steinernema hermaphroditum]
MASDFPCSNETTTDVAWKIGVGSGYLALFAFYMFPQVFVLTTTTQKTLLSQPSYKIMLATACVDMVQLTFVLALPGWLSLWRVVYCPSATWMKVIGHINMVLAFVYTMLRTTLSINRILQLGRPKLCMRLFDGTKAWYWVLWCFVFGFVLALGATGSAPLYFYDVDAGVWKFLWIKNNLLNVSHMFNNIYSLFMVSITEPTIIVLLRKKGFKVTSDISKVQRRITIQTIIVNIVFDVSHIFYLLVSYTPLKNVSCIGIVGEVLWATVHGSNGYSYLFLNRSVQEKIKNFLTKMECKKKQNALFSLSTQVTPVS